MTVRSQAHVRIERGWLRDQSRGFDVGICLTLPHATKVAEHGYDAQCVQRHVSRFFNRVDRRLMGNAHKRRGLRVQRLVVLEHSPVNGWHAHITAETPAGVDVERFIDVMRAEWWKEIKRDCVVCRKDLYCWFEPIDGAYAFYTIKGLKGLSDSEYVDKFDHAGIFDPLNSHFHKNHNDLSEGREAL